MNNEDDRHTEFVMPFVCCVSNGGPLDDHAFVAGANYGAHEAELRLNSPVEWQAYVHPEMVPQYDLLAMHLGYATSSEPWEEDPEGWVLLTLAREE